MSAYLKPSAPQIAKQPFQRTEPIAEIGMLRLTLLGGDSADVFLN